MINEYNTLENITGKVRELVQARVGATDSDLLQYGTRTVYTGYCETCYDQWDIFVVLKNREEVYRSSSYDGSPFKAFQDWLNDV